MKKRLLSVFLALCMALTLVPTAWAVDGDPGGESYSPGTIHINVGEEITLLGTEAESGHKWGIYQGSAGYDVSGLEIISGEDSESTYTVTVRASKAGDYGVRHYYTITDPDAPPLLQTQSKSEYFRIKVSNPEPTVADIEVYTNYVNDAADTLPYEVPQTFTYILEYHGTLSPSHTVQEDDFTAVRMQAEVTKANVLVKLEPVNKGDASQALVQGFYTVKLENGDVEDDPIYFEVTGTDSLGLDPDNAIRLVKFNGEPWTSYEENYYTLTLDASVFTDPGTDPDPDPDPVSDLTLAVGETGILVGDQPGPDETPNWEVEPDEGVIELVPETEPWKAAVKGLAVGEAEVIYSYGGYSRTYTVTVTAADPGGDEDPEVTKILYVDDDAAASGTQDGTSEYPFATVQAAINYIHTQEDKTGWTIEIRSGTYDRFVVSSGLDGLTVKAAEDEDVTIQTLNGNPIDYTFSNGQPDVGGIQIMEADNVIFDGLTIEIGTETTLTHHMCAGISNHSESTKQADNFTIRNCEFVGNGDMTGQANGNVGISISKFSSFTIEGCTFTNLMEAIRGQSDNADVTTVTITDNTFTACSFAIHEYAGDSVDDTQGTYTFTGNTITGTEELYCKAYFEDQFIDAVGKESNGYTVKISDNELTNAVIGLVNLEDNGGEADVILEANDMGDNTFVVTGAKAAGQIELHSNYVAPEDNEGQWVWTGKEDAEVDWCDNPEGANQMIQDAIDEANAKGSHTLTFDVDDPEKFLLTFTWFKDLIYWETDTTPDTDPEPPTVDWTRSKSKTATNLDRNYESRVTLSLPAAEEQLVSDVVFVLDKSTSAEVEEQLLTMLNDLNAQVTETGAKVNIGIVIFNRKANRVLELTELNADNIPEIKAAVETEISSGTNTHAGLLAGKEMLDADTDVAANRKYLVFISDGITYMYNAEPTAIGLQNGDKTNIFAGPDNWNTKYGNNNAPGNWETWLSVIAAMLETDADKNYDQPYSTNFNSGTVPYIAYDDRENHAMSIDKALYLTNQVYQEAKATGYHCYAMTATSNAIHPWAASFMSYLANGETVDFTDIQNDIYYLLDAGSYVVDEIGNDVYNGRAYDFDFVKDTDDLTLTVGGNQYTATAVTEGLSEGETARYTFTYEGVTATNGADAPFILRYFQDGTTYEGNEYDECFVWEINVPVSNFARVQLTYTVKLTDPQTASGTYGEYDEDGEETTSTGLYTNNSATLYPVDSNEEPGRPEDFAKPTVSYTVGDNTITITPADITIYMGGNDGYEAVVGEEGDSTGATTETNSLPRPMFRVTAPTGVDPEKLTFTSSEIFSGEGDTAVYKAWTLELAGETASENGEALYYMRPVNDGQDEVRVQFAREDDPTADPIVSDNFDPAAEKEMFVDYTIELYTGAVQTGGITVTDEEENAYTLGELGTGTLRVRAVDDTEDGQNPVTQVTTTVTEKVAAGEGAVTAPAGTSYTLNNTTVPVTGTGVGLLFDGIIDDSTANRTQALKDRVDDVMGEPGSRTTRHYQAQYLDLVDADNGNAWVMADKSVTVYWGYPSGTDSGDDFTLYHFKNLHRDDNGGLSGFDINEVDQAVMEKVEITKGQYGIMFEVPTGGFSPFVLVWETRSGGGGHYDPPDDDDDDTPSLNTKDHVAYVIGYPEDYVTGEPTDDASRWPVKPQGNITRAEVATIFFRLLTDDARDTYWSQSNPYSDVELEKWFNNAISTLSNMEIIEGYEDGTFQPNAPITRAEFTTMAVRFFDYADETYDDSGFTDVEPGMWYTDFINAAVELGLIEGYPDGTFRPNAPITRAEACTLVNRTLGREPHEDHLLPRREMNTWPDNPTNAWYYEAIQEATNSHDYNWTSEDGERVENWTEKLEERDWAELERAWSDAHDAPGGEVMD